MNFNCLKKRAGFTLLALLLIVAIIGLLAAIALPPQARAIELYTPGQTTGFSNAPALIGTSGISNATVTANSWRSNMVRIIPGKDLSLYSVFQQASNGQAATVSHYFGFVFNGTNTSTATNITWNISAPQSTGAQRWFTNIPSAVLGNADGLIWFSTQNGSTNTLIGNGLGGIVPK